MDNTEKIFIILGFLVIIIYFLYYFDLHSLIYGLFGFQKENFNSYLFQPTKLFRNGGRIYLLDTERVLEIKENPKIFNSFSEYQNYILNLEEEFKNDLFLKIGTDKKNIKDIKESDIKELDFRYKNKIETENKNPYYMNYQCQRQSAHCMLGEAEEKLDKEMLSKLTETEKNKFKVKDPYFSSIYDPIELRKFKEKNCRKKLLDKKQCQAIKTMTDNTESLNKICYDQKMRDPEFQKNFKVMCDKHKLIQNHRTFLEEQCEQDNNYEQNCMLEDLFRQNLLDITTLN